MQQRGSIRVSREHCVASSTAFLPCRTRQGAQLRCKKPRWEPVCKEPKKKTCELLTVFRACQLRAVHPQLHKCCSSTFGQSAERQDSDPLIYHGLLMHALKPCSFLFRDVGVKGTKWHRNEVGWVFFLCNTKSVVLNEAQIWNQQNTELMAADRCVGTQFKEPPCACVVEKWCSSCPSLKTTWRKNNRFRAKGVQLSSGGRMV